MEETVKMIEVLTENTGYECRLLIINGKCRIVTSRYLRVEGEVVKR